MKERIAITGSEGVIGTVLKNGLSRDYDITSLDLPTVDVRNYDALIKMFPGHAVAIHLAWDTETDNFKSERTNLENAVMFDNVYRAALAVAVPRVIMASSVHADRFYEPLGSVAKDPYIVPNPDSPYGAHKVYMEMLGKWYASEKGLEVICIRFGGVNPENKPPRVENHSDIAQRAERAVWLSHRDCVELVKKCIETKAVPDNFAIIYGVSNNTRRIHDISNPFGWKPKDCNDAFDETEKHK